MEMILYIASGALLAAGSFLVLVGTIAVLKFFRYRNLGLSYTEAADREEID